MAVAVRCGVIVEVGALPQVRGGDEHDDGIGDRPRPVGHTPLHGSCCFADDNFEEILGLMVQMKAVLQNIRRAQASRLDVSGARTRNPIVAGSDAVDLPNAAGDGLHPLRNSKANGRIANELHTPHRRRRI